MTEALHHHHHTHTHHHHADPFEVTIRVPTPEALHELSIFLQEFEKKYRQIPYHATFTQETTGAAPVLHGHLAAPAGERHQEAVPVHHGHIHDPLAGLGLGTVPVTMEELRALQVKLLEGGHLDAAAIGRYCAELGIDPANPIREHQYGELYAKIVKHLPKH